MSPSPPGGLPGALEHWPEIRSRLAGRRLALFLDYDGTLTPIVARPELAVLPAAVRETVRRLAGRAALVAVLSGRGREDVAALVGLDGLVYGGSHGFDIAGPPAEPGGPAVRHEAGGAAGGGPVPVRMDHLAARLRGELAGIRGCLVEPKRFSVAVHHRLVDGADLPRIEAAVERAARDPGDSGPPLRRAAGKKVFELRPDVDWDKGKALLWLLDRYHLGGPEVVPVFLGDDVTDEDAFAALRRHHGIGILVAEEPRGTAATYRLRDPGEVAELLAGLETAGFAAG